MSSKPITYKYIFNRKNRLNAKGEALIQLEAYKDGQRVYISTGIYVAPDNWDADKERIIKRRDHHNLNNRLFQQVETCKRVEFEHNRANPSFGVHDLKSALESTDKQSFTDFALQYLEQEKNLARPSYTKYLNSINSFKEFAGGNVKFSELSFELADSFRLHLVKEGISPNTQKVYIKHLSKYAKLAVSYGLLEHTKNPFPGVKIKGQQTERQALSDMDITKLEKLKFSKGEKHLEIIRDMFLFTCYTGLRFSDVSRLADEHIYSVKEGLELRMKAEKNAKAINLPLHLLHPVPGKPSKPEQLINKYQRNDKRPFFLSAKPQSKAANNQYTNRELKTIGERAGIKTRLTNHVGRHTFATFLIWRLPLPIVKELLQHSKIETTMIYIHVGTDKVKEHLRKITDWA